jgi:diacylglycerol kinase (ATP)
MTKRVTLFQNPGAGFDDYSGQELKKMLERKGYSVSYADVKQDDYLKKLQDPGELVVVAGGDGTVLRVAPQLTGLDIPIGLLPLGTANNIANSLGIKGKPEEIIAAWDTAKTRPFDVGIAKGQGKEMLFLESSGFGLLPKLIREHSKDDTEPENREEALQEALDHKLKLVQEYQAQECSIRLNGQSLSGRYLLVQLMNIGYVGPNLMLAPEADSADGLLDVVLIKEEEREMLADYLRRYSPGEAEPHPFTVVRAASVAISWHGKHYHVGDESLEGSSPIALQVSLLPKGLQFLRP